MSYTPLHTIQSRHTDSVNCLSFSPDGHFLASGGDDCTLFIFDFRQGRDVIKFVSSSPVASILWHPFEVGKVWVGYAKGNITLYDSIDKTGTIIPTGARDPIECMAFNVEMNLLAFATNCEVHIYLLTTVKNVHEETIVMRPSKPAAGVVQARALHFIREGRSLIISYFEHGILCWDVEHDKRHWHLSPRKLRIAHSAISSNHRYLVTANLCDGFDIYDLRSRELVHSIPIREVENIGIPVIFIGDKDNSILVGSSRGVVKIIDVETGIVSQTLNHPRWAIIQAVAFFYDRSEGAHYIGTATSEQGAATYVRIWKAADPESMSVGTATNISEVDTHDLEVISTEEPSGSAVAMNHGWGSWKIGLLFTSVLILVGLAMIQFETADVFHVNSAATRMPLEVLGYRTAAEEQDGLLSMNRTLGRYNPWGTTGEHYSGNAVIFDPPN